MSAVPATRTLVWASMLVGPVAYAGIVMSGIVPMNPEGLPDPARLALAGLAIVAVVASRVLWGRLTAGAEEEAGRAASPVPPPGPDRVLPRAVVVWALDESVAVLGFVLAWFGTPVLLCAPFFVVAIGLVALDHPGRLPA